MPMNATVPLIMAGAGHSHLVTLRTWLDQGYRPPPGTLLITPNANAWYSGMMPGLAAQRFDEPQCGIALEPWCRALGLEMRIDAVSGLDAPGQQLTLSSGTTLPYRLLSLNTGAENPGPSKNDGSIQVVPAKPFAGFTAAWNAWRAHPPAKLGLLGGGPAAFELGLALRHSLPASDIWLISGDELLIGHPAQLRHRARALLSQRGVRLLEGKHADAVTGGKLMGGGHTLLELDALVLASGASSPRWLAESGATLDDKGFVRVDPCLRSLSHTTLLASGDCAAVPGAQRSGVYAVRQGSVLAHNIPALLEGRSLHIYEAQPKALALLATADGGALMSYGPVSFGGRLPGLFKDYLDLRFMRRHSLSDKLAPLDTRA